MSESLSLRRATGEDRPFVESLLGDSDLPTADVWSDDATVWVATDSGERVGCGGLERCENAGLLRSVVVAESHRGRGLGTELCDGLETRAREHGVEELYLLTTTAAEFFAARGYERCERSDAPEAIRETTEFASLCPESATCMRKAL